MDETTRAHIETFVSHYQTLVIATEHEGQPYATRIFFVEDVATDTDFTIYATLITTSRKLANLQQNPQVGIFIGPDQPSTWMEATAYARILHDEHEAEQVRAKLARKSSIAAGFIAQVSTAAVELKIHWLRITDLTSSTPYTEAIFESTTPTEEQRA